MQVPALVTAQLPETSVKAAGAAGGSEGGGEDGGGLGGEAGARSASGDEGTACRKIHLGMRGQGPRTANSIETFDTPGRRQVRGIIEITGIPGDGEAISPRGGSESRDKHRGLKHSTKILTRYRQRQYRVPK